MYNPISTYRIQFHKDFTFKAFKAAIPYLAQLGVKTVYASPIFSAAPGSMHGYDVTDPWTINPEIGTETELLELSAQLKALGIGWLQDIVPNHMAFHPENAWLMDVLKNGKGSAYAGYFDILWDKQEQLMVPFLGRPLDEAIGEQELKLTADGDTYYIRYFDAAYPLRPESCAGVKRDDQHADIQRINDSPAALKAILDQQHYRLCHWQETDGHINFRRFFTVNGLICLNMQSQEVFDNYHRAVKSLLDKKVFDGLRVDHVDGLYDPTTYLERLRELAGTDTYLVVEKILEPGEKPENWPVQGNTGYDFLATVNNLFTYRKSERAFTDFYGRLVLDKTPVTNQIHEKKSHILQAHMRGELTNLYRLLIDLDLALEDAVPPEVLRESIAAFLVYCPVYRYYGNGMPLKPTEAAAVTAIFDNLLRTHGHLAQGIDLLRHVLLRKPAAGDPDYNERAAHFYQRLMQFTGPLMAKGVEDTLMYCYQRFIGHNDVGDAPDAFGITTEAFHKTMMDRQANWLLSMNATATHDTKRGEDFRARLNVLTELPQAWLKAVTGWQRMNKALRKNNMPDANDEYFIYQTLAGSYIPDAGAEDNYGQRLQEYMEKALREAKRRSGWDKPDEAYEAATRSFIEHLLDRRHPFLDSLTSFIRQIEDHGRINSLAQTLLRFSCPGMPDTYQGTELWDFSFVDPDNRRPVNYEARLEYLHTLKANEDVRGLWAKRKNGAIKLWLTHTMLQLRAANFTLFESGIYKPLKVEGTYKNHVIAFARSYQDTWIVVATALHTAHLCRQQETTLDDIDWKQTFIRLPAAAPGQWQQLLFNGQLQQSNGCLMINDLFTDLPMAVLQLKAHTSHRAAGILLSIGSLPSSFGIGDVGPGAVQFAKALARCGQRYWQVLPLNPVAPESAFSPYSSISTLAGNALYISPEQLATDGLLTGDELQGVSLPSTDKTDYKRAIQLKEQLLRTAYERFRDGDGTSLKAAFAQFEQKESHWLDDFALYVVLKRQHKNEPWYRWPERYRMRQPEPLQQFADTSGQELRYIKWQQFIFLRQWQSLRKVCNALGVKLIGDLPFYASYDSADVWTNPGLFSLDGKGTMTGSAGVPPDYFSKTGQLWGMPTYRWAAHKEDDYQWWMNRLKKNLELYDLLRIDHFRALAAFWEVPASEETAVNGQWIEGPGTAFFDIVRERFGDMPFIAEDLGDNMEDVYKLRDAVQLPGMKIMQFAFGENMPFSVDAPHNYPSRCIAYSGTHDNNTTLGWYMEETTPADKNRITAYTGQKVNERNVNEVIARLVYGSVAELAILPAQDVLGLGADSRMNTPSSAAGNWSWRMLPGQLTALKEQWLLTMARRYGRY